MRDGGIKEASPPFDPGGTPPSPVFPDELQVDRLEASPVLFFFFFDGTINTGSPLALKNYLSGLQGLLGTRAHDDLPFPPRFGEQPQNCPSPAAIHRSVFPFFCARITPGSLKKRFVWGLPPPIFSRVLAESIGLRASYYIAFQLSSLVA